MNFNLATKVIIVTAIAVSIMNFFGNKGILITFALIGLLLLAIFKFQNKLLYMPDIPNSPHSPKDNPKGYSHPQDQGLNSKNVLIVTADNVSLRGWIITGPNTTRLVVYFHQNAGNIGWRIPFVKRIHQETNSDVLMVAYRGYSDSDGQPTEQGLKLDAQAIMEYAINHERPTLGKQKEIYLLGRSLGGAVSIYLSTLQAFSKEIKGFILQNTFTSIQDMVKILFPPLSYLTFLHRNFWPSKDLISQIQTPILFIRSLKDEIVPTDQMLELIRLAQKCRVKEEYEIPRGTHNVSWEVNPREYFNRWNQYFHKLESM